MASKRSTAWETTSARHWPEDLITGVYPDRGTNAVHEQARLDDLLRDGWEPFAVLPEHESSLIWLKRNRPDENTDFDWEPPEG